MARPNTSDPEVQVRYSSVAIVLHWVLALALAFQIALGFAMPDGPSGFDEYQLHKSVGIAILLLTLVRLGWKLGHPAMPSSEGGLNGFLAKAVHTGFYVFLIGAPLTGWAIVSSSRIEVPTVVFGVLPWPHLPIGRGVNDFAEAAHEWLSWIGIVLFVLHVAGALRHHLLLRDGLLARMAPGGSTLAAMALAALVVGLFFATGTVVAGGQEEDRAPATTAAPAVTAGARPPADEDRVEEAAEAAAAEAREAEEAALEGSEDAAEDAADEPGPPPEWTIAPGGRLGFSVGGSQGGGRGTFSDWSGAIRFDPENPETATIRIDVRLASASLGDETMDGMLQGAEFFASAANPTATWRSTSVRRAGGNRYTAQGTLSLRGASRPQALSFTLTGDGPRRRVEGNASIDRAAFGIGTGDSGQGLDPAVAVSFVFDATSRTP